MSNFSGWELVMMAGWTTAICVLTWVACWSSKLAIDRAAELDKTVGELIELMKERD